MSLSLLGIILFTVCIGEERRRQPGGASTFNTTIYDNMDLLTLNLTINDTFYRGVKYIDSSTGERVAIDVGLYVIPAGCYPCSGGNKCINVYRMFACATMAGCNWQSNDPGYGCEELMDPHVTSTDDPTSYPSQPMETVKTWGPTRDPTASPTNVPTLNNTITFGRTHWGEWGPLFSCPADSYVDGFRLRVEALVGMNFDDTALNTIEVHCSSGETGTSREGDNGIWTQWQYCPENLVAVGAEFKSVSELTTGGGISGPDNTAGTDLNLRCNDFSVILGNSGWNPGLWQSQDCPNMMAISGIRTQVESNCSSSCTGLNQVHFTCAPAPGGYFIMEEPSSLPTEYRSPTGDPTSFVIPSPIKMPTSSPIMMPTTNPSDERLEVVFRLAGDLTQSQAEMLNVAIANVLDIEVSDVIVVSALWRASSTRRRQQMDNGYWEVEVEIYANEQSDLENIKTQLEDSDGTINAIAGEMRLNYDVAAYLEVESMAVHASATTTDTTTEGGIGFLTIVIVLGCIGIVVLLGGLLYYRHRRDQNRRCVSDVKSKLENLNPDMGEKWSAGGGKTEIEGEKASTANVCVPAKSGEVELEETGHLLEEPTRKASQGENGVNI